MHRRHGDRASRRQCRQPFGLGLQLGEALRGKRLDESTVA
jgi:hypothetical protein